MIGNRGCLPLMRSGNGPGLFRGLRFLCKLTVTVGSAEATVPVGLLSPASSCYRATGDVRDLLKKRLMLSGGCRWMGDLKEPRGGTARGHGGTRAGGGSSAMRTKTFEVQHLLSFQFPFNYLRVIILHCGVSTGAGGRRGGACPRYSTS